MKVICKMLFMSYIKRINGNKIEDLIPTGNHPDIKFDLDGIKLNFDDKIKVRLASYTLDDILNLLCQNIKHYKIDDKVKIYFIKSFLSDLKKEEYYKDLKNLIEKIEVKMIVKEL